MVTISREAREELVRAVAKRYHASNKAEKTRILDAFVQMTGYHRKHAIRVLRGSATIKETSRVEQPRIYGSEVRKALVVLWETSRRSCGKRLQPLIPGLIESLERSDKLQLDELVRGKLLRISASTIDRILVPERAAVAVCEETRPKKSAPLAP